MNLCVAGELQLSSTQYVMCGRWAVGDRESVKDARRTFHGFDRLLGSDFCDESLDFNADVVDSIVHFWSFFDSPRSLGGMFLSGFRWRKMPATNR